MNDLDREASERIVSIERQGAKNKLLKQYIEAAMATDKAINAEPVWSRRWHVLVDHFSEQVQAIATNADIPYLMAEEFVTGKSMAAAEKIAKRIGRGILIRMGYELPEETNK